MKMRYNILGLAGLMFLLASCHKFLDQEPSSVATDQTTWKSDGDANASVGACYSLIRSAFNASITYYSYGDLASDEFSDVVGGDFAYKDVQDMNWGVGIPAANNYDPRLKLRLFSNFYTAIAQSNRCLHFINNMSVGLFNGSDAASQQERKNHFLGEAYFTRAFNYFMIARTWGDAPIVTEYYADNSTAPQLARSPQSQVLAQCISDLDQAKQFLDWRDLSSQDQVVRADKGAVFALMAHIYAWKGNYDSCNMACDSVIGSQSYTLVDGANYMDIYKGQSQESIFEISQNSQSESMRATDVYSLTGVLLAPPYINVGTTVPAWQINTGLTDYLYSDTNDIRWKKAFVTLPNGGSSPVECIKYSNIQNINNNTAYQVAENNILIFRLADIELLKAEALAARTVPDEGGALALVNAIRLRAGLTTPLAGLTGTDLLYAIADERGRELFLEGHRYYDLVRLERLTGDQQFPYMSTAEFQLGKCYWPIDPSLFLINSKLVQTDFWRGKVN
jgi:hypothetical protein